MRAEFSEKGFNSDTIKNMASAIPDGRPLVAEDSAGMSGIPRESDRPETTIFTPVDLSPSTPQSFVPDVVAAYRDVVTMVGKVTQVARFLDHVADGGKPKE